MIPILVNSREEYSYCVDRGFNPLIDYKNFTLDINLRVEIQREIFGHCIFGRGDVMVANARFFRWIWEHKPHMCEETMKPLHSFSATFCSHILTRGGHPELAHDPRNINILSFEQHNRWEHGDRKNMRIYPENQRVIEMLKKDYQKLKL